MGKRILIFGGTGMFGTQLLKYCNLNNEYEIICLGTVHGDIKNLSTVDKLIKKYNPDIVVNAAAFTNSTQVLSEIETVYDTNIIGSANIARTCIKYNKRLVYISTDYVYNGIGGNFKETDPVNPINEYAWTKLSGEINTMLVKNDYAIIRTSFGRFKFPYKYAYTNLYTSKDYVDVIIPKIFKVIVSNFTGIINIGTHRKSMYEYAKKYNIYIKESERPVTIDVSLNTELYEQYFNPNK